MNSQLFNKENLISLLNSQISLTNFNSFSTKGRTLYSISTNDNSIFLFFKSYSLVNPLVCKISTGSENVIYTSISPSLEQLAIISNSSNISIISLKPFLDYDSSSHINSCITKDHFPASYLNLSNFSAAHYYPNFSFEAITKNKIIAAFWWKLPGTFMNLIIVEETGFIIAHLYDYPIQQKHFSLNDICNINEPINSSLYKQIGNKAMLVIATNSHLVSISFTQNFKNEIEIEKQICNITLNQNEQQLMQISDNEAWFLALLQNNITFIDSNMDIIKEIPINIQPSSDINQISSFCISKHFLFQITSGNLYVKFLHNAIDDFNNDLHDFCCIDKECLQIYLIDYEKDLIAVMKTTSCEIIEFNINPEKYALSLIRANKIEESKILAANFDLEFQDIMIKSCFDLIKEKQIFHALNLITQNTISIKECIKELILHGYERIALHIIITQNIDNKRILSELLIQKIFEKNKIFPVFEKLYLSLEFENTNNENKYRKTFHFPSPDEFAKSDLLQELKNNEASFLDIFPAALIFHFEMINKIETKSLNVLKAASLLDIPKNKSGFSPEFAQLLTMLSHYLPSKEESLPFPISSQIESFNDYTQTKVHISNKILYIGNKEVLRDVDSFCIFNNKLFVLLINHFVMYSKIEEIDFKQLDIAPSLYICSSQNIFAALTITGPILYLQQNPESNKNEYQYNDFNIYEGSFVDIAICNNRVYGLDDEGQVIDISNDGKIIYNSHFVKEILSSKTSLICRTLTSDIDIISVNDGNIVSSIHVDFKIERAKSGNKAIIAGEGKIMLIQDSKNIEIKEYSRRIGTLLDANIENETILLAGSSAGPVRILLQERQQDNNSRESLSFSDFQKIYKYFHDSLLFGLFKDHTSVIYLTVLYKKWELLSGDVMNIINILDELPLDHSIETVHALISRKLLDQIDSEVLKQQLFKKIYTNKCLIKYPNDIRLIPQRYYLDLIPERKMINKFEIAQNLLQKHNNPICISSNNLNMSELVVFSCGHLMERNELLKLVHNHSQSAKLYIKEAYKFYCLQNIPMQCPKCLETELKNSGML